jgi:ribosomal-protein-alanine N-acetyltransferase
MTVTTARLALTPFADDHVDALLDLFRDPHVRRYLLDDAIVSRAWVADEVQASRHRFATGSLGLYAASRLDAPPSLVGFAGFRPFYDPPVLQLVYGVAPAYVGRGLAREMAQAVIDLAFTVHGFAEVRASTDAPNHASARVLAHLGMKLVATEPGEPWPQLHFVLARREP